MLSVEVLHALGAGPGSPLCVQVGGHGRAVLDRIAPPELSKVQDTHVLQPMGAMEVDGRPMSLYPLHPGACLGALLDRHPAGLEGPWLAAIARDAIRGLDALHEAGLGHGDVRDGTLRIGTDGVARWVGVVGGEPGRDRRALADLLERALADEVGEDWVQAIQDLDLAWLEARAVERAAPGIERAEPGGHAGRMLSEGASTTEPPPRLVVARISALVGVLALAVGWFMRPIPPAPDVQVVVPGAAELGMTCTGDSCEVWARMGQTLVRTQVDARTGGRYRCSADEDQLICEVVLPR